MSVKRVVLLAGIDLVLAVYFIGRKVSEPNLSLVNGSYANSCCAAVLLKDGHGHFGTGQFTYKLYRMKFGLTAYLPGSLTRQGVQASNEETALIFLGHDGSRGFRTAVDGQEYEFVRSQ